MQPLHTACPLSVVIVTWEAAALTLRCLERLAPELEPDDEVIVVDNGSHDGSVAAIAGRWPGVRLVRLEANRGFAGGVEAGLREASVPWILTLNNDAWPEPGALASLRAAVGKAGDDVAAMQPLLLFDRAGADVINSSGLRLLRHGGAIDRDVHLPRDQAAAAGEVFGASAGAALYRRAALDAVRLPSGVFDVRFFMYFEDVDLAWRLQLAGWRALFVPDATFRHESRTSTKRHGAGFTTRQCAQNRLRLLMRNASLPMLATTLHHTAGDLVWLARRDRAGGVKAWGRALQQGLSERPAIDRQRRNARGAVERRWCEPVGRGARRFGA